MAVVGRLGQKWGKKGQKRLFLLGNLPRERAARTGVEPVHQP
jgi:hypothetical protein